MEKQIKMEETKEYHDVQSMEFCLLLGEFVEFDLDTDKMMMMMMMTLPFIVVTAVMTATLMMIIIFIIMAVMTTMTVMMMMVMTKAVHSGGNKGDSILVVLSLQVTELFFDSITRFSHCELEGLVGLVRPLGVFIDVLINISLIFINISPTAVTGSFIRSFVVLLVIRPL